jgi:hypothetical protein
MHSNREHGRGDGGAAQVIRQRLAARVGLSLLGAGLLLAGCTGHVDGGGQPTPPDDSTGPGPMVPGPLPEDAPVTGAFPSAPGPSSRFVRLSHKQWENTISDLFRGGGPTGLSASFLSEPIRSSFDNNGSILEVSAAMFSGYQAAAQKVAKAARESKLYDLFLGGAAKDGATFVRNFGLRAFRRPLTDAEVSQYQGLFAKAPMLTDNTDAFADGVELVVEAMLQSPHFLYRAELGTNVVGGRVPLNDYEIATRLSYGLVNSMPDEPLFAAAAGNKLKNRNELIAQATRLLESERGKAALQDLHDQSLHLAEYAEVKRDTKVFPEWRAEMGADMRDEARTFVREVIFSGKGVTELLTAPYTYVNSRLAPLYGANVPAGNSGFVKVDLNPAQRAGLYTQVGFLANNATDYNPRTIMRGVHVNLDALCVELPAPPNVPPEPPADQGKTNRQQVQAFTEMEGSVCVGCHGALINPLGFPFENFDGLGKFRTTEAGGLPIDASSKYSFAEGEKKFNGAVELMKTVAAGRQAHECYAEKLFEYIYGRERVREGELVAADKGVISEVGRRSRLKVPIKSMILDLVSTDAFVTRLP